MPRATRPTAALPPPRRRDDTGCSDWGAMMTTGSGESANERALNLGRA
jgi:hypothetical protein